MRSEFVPRINGSGNIVSRAQQAGVTPDFIMANNQHVPACHASTLYGAESGHLVTFFPEDGDFAEKKEALLQEFSNAGAVVSESLTNALSEAEYQCLGNGKIAWIRALAVMLNHSLIHPSDLKGELIKSGTGFAHPYAWRYIAESMATPDLAIYGEWIYTSAGVGSTYGDLGVHVRPQDVNKQIVTFAKFGHYNSSSFAPVDERWPTYYGNAYYQERYLDVDGYWYASAPKKYIVDENCTRAYFNAQMGHIQDEDFPEKSVSAVFLVDGTNAFTDRELDLPYEYLTKYNIFRFFRAYSAYNLGCGWGTDLASPFKRDSWIELGTYASWTQLKTWVANSVCDASQYKTSLWDILSEYIGGSLLGEYDTTSDGGKAVVVGTGGFGQGVLISSVVYSLEGHTDDNIGELVDDGSTTPIVAYKRQRITAQSSDGYDCITVENRDALPFETVLDHFMAFARNVTFNIVLRSHLPQKTIWEGLSTTKKLQLIKDYADDSIPRGTVTISGDPSASVRTEIDNGVGEVYYYPGTNTLKLGAILSAIGLPIASQYVDDIYKKLTAGINLTFYLNENLPDYAVDPPVKAFIFGPGSITGDPTNEWLDV